MSSSHEAAGRLTALDVLAASLADMPSEISFNNISGDAAVIKAPASFDIFTASAVRALTIRLQGDFVTRIVFDLSAVTFMDNTALGVIAGARTRLRRAGGHAAVAAATEPVARMFRLTGLDQHVPMYASAVEAASAPRPAN
jgi:anti-sigma B factor antagonist